jgi:hypothetical protein
LSDIDLFYRRSCFLANGYLSCYTQIRWRPVFATAQPGHAYYEKRSGNTFSGFEFLHTGGGDLPPILMLEE